MRAVNTQTDRFAHIVNMNDLSARSSRFSGGSIDCQSTPGAGTTFTMQLELGTAAQTAPASDSTASDLRGLRLLAAEDNDLNREIAQTLLGEHSIICDRAENGQEYVDMLFSALAGTLCPHPYGHPDAH